MHVGSLDLADTEMQVILLKDVVHDPQGPLESLLEDLSHHIDTLADKGHHFVIDTADTALMQHARSEEQVGAVLGGGYHWHVWGCHKVGGGYHWVGGGTTEWVGVPLSGWGYNWVVWGTTGWLGVPLDGWGYH